MGRLKGFGQVVVVERLALEWRERTAGLLSRNRPRFESSVVKNMICFGVESSNGTVGVVRSAVPLQTYKSTI